MNKKQFKKQKKKWWRSLILYVLLLGGSSILGVGMVHYLFNPSNDHASSSLSYEEIDHVQNENKQSSVIENNNDSENNGEEAKDSEESSSSSNTVENNTDVQQASWEPVGTEQEEPHQTNYDMESVDWAEMTLAFSVAIDTTPENIILWWVGRDGAHNKSFGVVSQRGVKNYKRVAIEWVTNKGWKPTDVRDANEEEYNKYIKKYVE
jgi:hypothetical protein